MANAPVDRLAELGMPPELAQEVLKFAVAGSASVAGLTPIATADATDPASTQALANACKAKINEIISALQS